MPSVKSRHAIGGQTESALLKSMWKEVRGQLEKRRDRIFEEIGKYPRPIPGCDQQFNHLLDQREQISRELDRMDALSRESLTRRDGIELVDEFIRSSACIDDEAGQAIRSRLKQAER
ncbi:MAG: hypothetical protein WA373_06235 [Burkholderiales bacterium]